MTTPIRFFAGLAITLALLGCAASRPKPDWTSAADVDIPAYATFGWADRPAEAPRGLMDTQVRAAIRAELIEKGYTEATDAPDFLVGFDSVEYETSKESMPVSIGIGMGSWGGSAGGGVGASVPVGGGEEEVSLQNRLTVRALDTQSDSEVWLGTTTSFEYPADAAVIDEAIAGVMAGFPARRN